MYPIRQSPIFLRIREIKEEERHFRDQIEEIWKKIYPIHVKNNLDKKEDPVKNQD